jgi:PPOX class probable FMN-dependent enzyme
LARTRDHDEAMSVGAAAPRPLSCVGSGRSQCPSGVVARRPPSRLIPRGPERTLVADQTLELRSRLQHVVSHEFELRRIIGKPSFWFQSKMLTHLTSGCRDVIAASPFMIIASTGAAGAVDASPRGDPAGFVRVLDDATLAIPDRPGNRRCDALQNILDRPRIGLIFFVRGKIETLRISGHAVVVRDRELRESLALDGRLPDLAVVVGIDRAFFHCARSIRRSKLWEAGGLPGFR